MTNNGTRCSLHSVIFINAFISAITAVGHGRNLKQSLCRFIFSYIAKAASFVFVLLVVES